MIGIRWQWLNRAKLKGSGRMKKECLVVPLLVISLVAVANLAWASPDLQVFVFPEVKGWKQSVEIQTFTPKTLFEYINGDADLYIMYDFQELKVAEYLNGKKASVIMDVYRHKTPTHAFGIYSQERLPNANFINIGAQGYIENNVLNFLTGPYYVKINSYNTGAEDQEILFAFAKKVAGNLGEKGGLPSILSSFPEEGKKRNSEKFINRNFLGYAFFHSAFTADYEIFGKKFKLFVIEGEDQKDCNEMIQKYLQQTGNREKNILESIYGVSDPYHGDIEFHRKGRFIWGALNLDDSSLRSKYLALFGERLWKVK